MIPLTTAIVLAGGFGTRLRTVISDVPKPMAPIGGRPFLAYQLDYWVQQGVSHFILSVGYKYESIMTYFGERYLEASIEYAVEPTALGTGGGFVFATRYLKQADHPFLVLNGDTYFEVNLKKLHDFSQEHQADWSMALFKTHDAARYMGVEVESNGRITSLNLQRQQTQVLANGGVYWVHPRMLSQLTQAPLCAFSLEKDCLPALLKQNCRLFAQPHHGQFIDIGIPEDYHRAAGLLCEDGIQKESYHEH